MAGELLYGAYLVVFGLAALACFAAVPRSGQVADPDTRRGLVWLLLTSGGWAAAHVGYLLVPTVSAKVGFYLAGLVVGLAAVGAWLYFCSAYTGRALHRHRGIRLVAVTTFLGLTAVKLTNPLHEAYFTAALVTRPFPHLAVQLGLLHWLAMGVSYALAVVGYFMLLELFLEVGSDTRPFVALVGITGLPVVLSVLGQEVELLLTITYEPLGVAVFAVGVSFVYHGRFQAIQVAAERNTPSIVVTEAGRIRDHNSRARELFPTLRTGTVGSPLATVLPDVAAAAEDDPGIIEIDGGERNRYVRVSATPVGSTPASLGRQISLIDVTEEERYRRALERQNERLDAFAATVSHDLRNPLTVAAGRLEMARDDRDDEHLAAVDTALDRMATLIDDVLDLARQGEAVDDMQRVTLAAAAERAWRMVDTDRASLVIDADVALEADKDRLTRLFENLYRNALEHGGTDVTVTVAPIDGDGFYVADDGPGVPPDDREAVFETGYSTADAGTGFGLAIVAEIVSAHGWAIDLVEGADGGARFEITGANVTPVD